MKCHPVVFEAFFKGLFVNEMANQTEANMTLPIPDYTYRLMALNQRLHARGIDMTGKFINAYVRHDDWCRIYKGKQCNCDPIVEIEVDGVMYGEDARPAAANDDDGCDRAA